jgi:hypothetical protein
VTISAKRRRDNNRKNKEFQQDSQSKCEHLNILNQKESIKNFNMLKHSLNQTKIHREKEKLL